MFSISESYFAELHNLGLSSLKQLRESFDVNFPFSWEILLPRSDYIRMLDDATEFAGVGHPESIRDYSNRNFNWSIYHPKKSIVYRNGDLLMAARVGFFQRRSAMQFKLKWYQN